MTILNSHIPDTNFEDQILQQVSRSFALTIPQLPPGLRHQVANAYLLCRIVDTIEDDAGLSLSLKRAYMDRFLGVVTARESVQQFSDDLIGLLSADTPEGEKELIRNVPRVVETLFSFKPQQQTAIRRCLETMGGGMLKFQAPVGTRGLESIKRMNDYCYYIAGVVGEMLTELFCDYSSEIAKHREALLRLAASFGQGLQMTNILKDFWEDRARGACWLPRDLFSAAGCDLDEMEYGCNMAAFCDGLTTLVGITRGHLESALAFTLLIPKQETGIRKFCLWAIGMAYFYTSENWWKP